MPAFGRLIATDARDLAFPMRLVLDPLRDAAFPRGVPLGTRHFNSGPILNQRNTGTCVLHGWTSKAEDAPIMQVPSLSPYDLYRKTVLLDEFPDNDTEATAADDALQYGTSVRAGAKVLQSLGLLESYLWAETVEDIRAWHLIGKGGVVLGITWKSDMMATDHDGFINYTGQIEGGHCVCTTGWSDTVQHRGRTVAAVRIQQSWGLPWGDHGHGRCWMEKDDLVKAMADLGEACAAIELRVKKVV